MNENEVQRISSISQVISDLLDGGTPEPVNLAVIENDQLQQLAEMTNRLSAELSAATRATDALSRGDTSPLVDSNISFARPLKTLQAALKQLTWQTSQIASGDFTHRTDFPGEFSVSFNQMVEQLQASQHHLEELVNERTKELSILLNTSTKTSQTQDLNTILKLFSEMLIRSFSYHTYCRVAIMDRSKQYFELKTTSSIRSLKLDSNVGKSFCLDDFALLQETLTNQDLRIIYSDNDTLTEKEKEFLFRSVFQSVLIIPFIEEYGLLGFAIISEARNPSRSDFHAEELDFYKTLANNVSTAISNACLLSSNEIVFTHTIESLAAALDARDSYTLYHSRNVTRYATMIAREMNFTPEEMETLKTACMLHDIGKIGIKDEILMKPGPLTSEEFDVIKTHPLQAVKILEPVKELKDIIDIIAAHHEHYDGSGYPYGLKGEDIPIESRIITLADYLDALTSKRVYGNTLKKSAAVARIKRGAGSMFDPRVVEAFLTIAPSLSIAPE
jgi:putative nucleotidyltransferase with HDIG domain